MSDVETFKINSELTRDAVYSGIWTRVCAELADHEADRPWRPRVEPLAVTRGGDATALLGYIAEADIDFLTDARRRFLAVEQTPLDSTVEVDDVWRFMPRAWDEDEGRWLWAPSEITEAENLGHRVMKVREFGRDEQLRGD